MEHIRLYRKHSGSPWLVPLFLMIGLLIITLMGTPRSNSPTQIINLSLQGNDACQLKTNLEFNNLYSEIQYDEASKIFSYSSAFSEENGRPLPDVIHFVVVPQDQALYYAGRYIDIFIDARNSREPIVTGYVFNGLYPQVNRGVLSNACNDTFTYSFQDRSASENGLIPDKLFSSLDSRSADVVALNLVQDETRAGIKHRTFEIKLDTNLISKSTANYCKDIYHQNAPSCIFDGLKMRTSPDRAGFFWFASSGSRLNYSFDGFISSYTWNKCFACFNQSITSNRAPLCKATSINHQKTSPGLKTSISLEFYDFESDRLQIAINKLPESAVLSPEAGTEITPNPTTGLAQVNLDWTPRLSQVGQHYLTVWASQDYGINKATAACNIEVTVAGLGDYERTCQAVDLKNSKREIEKQVAEIRKHSRRIVALLKTNRSATKREEKLLKSVDQNYRLTSAGSGGALTEIKDIGYRGSCPTYCPQDTKITLARIRAKAAVFEMSKNAVRIARQASKKMKSAGQTRTAQIITSLTSKIIQAENKAQSLLSEQVPSELFDCSF